MVLIVEASCSLKFFLVFFAGNNFVDIRCFERTGDYATTEAGNFRLFLLVFVCKFLVTLIFLLLVSEKLARKIQFTINITLAFLTIYSNSSDIS